MGRFIIISRVADLIIRGLSYSVYVEKISCANLNFRDPTSNSDLLLPPNTAALHSLKIQSVCRTTLQSTLQNLKI